MSVSPVCSERASPLPSAGLAAVWSVVSRAAGLCVPCPAPLLAVPVPAADVAIPCLAAADRCRVGRETGGPLPACPVGPPQSGPAE